MSVLPKIPYTMRKNKSQVVAMRGINYSNVTRDGDIADSKGISARSYPYITTRKAREKQGQYSNVTAMTVFNNKIVVVADGKLYYDGHEIGELTPGEKQFAPINSKLCVMPDKKYFDSRTMTLEDMGAEAHSLGAEFTKNSVTLDEWWTQRAWGYGYDIAGVEGNILTVPRHIYVKRKGDGYFIRVYQRSTPHYDEKNTLIGLSIIQYAELHRNLGRAKIGVVNLNFKEYNSITFPNEINTSKIEVEDLLYLGGRIFKVYEKPQATILYCKEWMNDHWGVNYYSNNIEGEIHKIEDFPEFFVNYDKYIYLNIDNDVFIKSLVRGTQTETFGKAISIDFGYQEVYRPPLRNDIEELRWVYNFCSEGPEDGIYDCDLATVGWDVDFTKILTVGQEATLKNASGNVFKSEITELTESTITFNDVIGDSLGSDNIHLIERLSIYVSEWDDGSEEIKNLGKYFKKGDCVTISGSTGNDMSFIIDGIDGLKLTASAEIFVEGKDTRFIMIKRRIPEFDYICSSENRIWGCSNKDNTIYASALGDPTNFFVNTGISTDSYAVAVGSEGRFTACCRFGSSVLFWKETKLHKILGSYPSEYTMYSYDFEGVQEGSHKSLQIINEVLYYKGIHGIYAFDSSPTLISSNFGDKYFTDAVAGVDGDSYYISMRGEDERDYLFVYETLPRLWVLEDDVKVFDFARIGKDMYMLTEGGEFYLCGAKDTETDMEWQVQLTPFYETIEGRKTYSILLLRVELPQGSYLRVEVRADGRAWHEAGKIVGKRQDVVPVLIPVNRCDKFEIRLSGKGKCTVMSMLREFYVGGEK